ncbi:MAG: substrate-binding domain-containing protein [Bacillota bacterium]
MKSKKIMALALAGILAVTMLGGCGGGDNADGNSDQNSSDEKKLTIVMSQRDEWLSTLDAAAKAAAEEMGYSLNSLDAQADASKQIQFVETARNNGEKAIIVNLVDPNTAADIVEAAGDMKVVFVNRPPADTSILNENVVYVGSNEMTSGKFQGEWLAEYFKAQGKTEIKYILLNGILGQVSTTNRTKSVLQALKDNGITAVEASAPLACDYDRAKAMNQIGPLLSTGTKFDAIIANNDAMALGAIEAMEQQDMDPSTVPIVGIDATADAVAAIQAGKLAMSVFQDPKGQGTGAILAAINLIEGKAINDGIDYQLDTEIPYIVWVPFEPVTPENVADYAK